MSSAGRPRLRHALRALAPGRLTGPVLVLMGGTVVAQAVAYLARPVLTRLFTPEAFGAFGFYLAVVGTAAAAATGRYEAAIPLPASDRDGAGVWALALALGAAAAALALLVVPFRAPLAAAVGRPDLAGLLALVPAGVLAASWATATEAWLARRERFSTVSSARVAQSTTGVPAQLAAGLAGAGAAGLVGGHLAGRAVGVAVLAWRSAGELRGAWRGVAALARRYRRFPAFSMPSGVLNTLSTQLPAFFLLRQGEALGLYVLAFGTLAVPLQLVGSSVGQVFFVRAAQAHRDGRLARLTGRVFSRLSAVGLFPIAAVALAGPAVFAVVFGEAWRGAGLYAAFLAPWLYFVFVSSPLSTLFDVLERQPWELGFNVASTVMRAVALAAGGWAAGATGAVAAFGAASAALWLGHTVWMLRWGGVPLGGAARTVGRHAAVAAVPLAVVAGAVTWGAGDVEVLATLVASAVLWVGLTAWAEPGVWRRPT